MLVEFHTIVVLGRDVQTGDPLNANRPGLRSGASVRWVDEFTLNNANTVFNWAYTVVDLRFGYDTKWGDVDVRPFVGIDNLFDERYNSSAITNAFGGRYYEPSPDREIYVGLTVGAGVR